MAYVPVIFAIWFFIPAVEILMACLSSDIIDGVCIPWGVYNSVAEEKTVAFFLFLVGYLLPLVLMIFFYSRIVYALRTKVQYVYHCGHYLSHCLLI